MAEFPNCPKCHRNDHVTGIPTSFVCSRCGSTFIPDKKIVSARITNLPCGFGDPLPEVMVKFEGEEQEKKLFTFYPDEIMFRSEEFIGLTEDQACELKLKKDKQWIQSSSYEPVY